MSGQTFDAISLGIMWDRLVSIVDEIVSTLTRLRLRPTRYIGRR